MQLGVFFEPCSRLAARRSTLGPRHSLVLEEPPLACADPRPLSAGLDPRLKAALRTADTEERLQSAVAATVASAIRLSDHRRFVQDLDDAWLVTKAFRRDGTSEIVTMTTAIRDTLSEELQCPLKNKAGALRPWREVFALFSLVAELCWRNYLRPSSQSIRKSLHQLLDDEVRLQAGGRCIEICAFFLAHVGELLCRNSLEVYTALQPLLARLDVTMQPQRTQWFVWVLLQRARHGWAGSVFLEASEEYWQDWNLAGLVLLAGHLEDPSTCTLAALPANARDLIVSAICSPSPWEDAVVVWHHPDSLPTLPSKIGDLHGSLLVELTSCLQAHSRLHTPMPVDNETSSESGDSSSAESSGSSLE